LNDVSAAVWKACDGTRGIDEIATETGLDLAAAQLALDSLAEIELISGHERTGISRRTALHRISVGAAGLAIALPVIRSITAPTAAMAYCTGAGGHCTSTNECCVSSVCNGSSSCRFYNTILAPGDVCADNAQCDHGSNCLGGACAPLMA